MWEERECGREGSVGGRGVCEGREGLSVHSGGGECMEVEGMW